MRKGGGILHGWVVESIRDRVRRLVGRKGGVKGVKIRGCIQGRACDGPDDLGKVFLGSPLGLLGQPLAELWIDSPLACPPAPSSPPRIRPIPSPHRHGRAKRVLQRRLQLCSSNTLPDSGRRSRRQILRERRQPLPSLPLSPHTLCLSLPQRRVERRKPPSPV